MAARVDRQLGSGAYTADGRRDKDLVCRWRGQIDLTYRGLIRFKDDGLTGFHGVLASTEWVSLLFSDCMAVDLWWHAESDFHEVARARTSHVKVPHITYNSDSFPADRGDGDHDLVFLQTMRQGSRPA